MSDQQTPTPEQTPNATPDAKGGDAYAAALKSITAERDALASQIKARDEQLAALTGERDGLKAQIDLFGKQQREGANVEAIRGKLPHLSAFEIRSALLGLHDEGVLDRYSDKPDEVATAALAAMQTKAPALLRPPAQGGGPGGVPEQKPARRQVMRF